MSTTARPRPASRRLYTLVLTHEDLLALLNDDFARECRSVYGYAVHAERLAAAGRANRAAAVERRGRLEVTHSLILCQVLYDFGGTVTAPVDELNAVLNADRVAEPGWEVESARRLRDRVRQLRAVGEPGLAKRLARVVAEKRASADLADLLED